MKDLRITVGVAAALMASACGPAETEQDNGWTADRDTAVCVDQQGKRVPDDKCPKTAQGQQQVGANHSFASPFLWYYLGRMSAVPAYGAPVYGGGYAPTAGHGYVRAPAASTARSGAVTRGGFGASARGFFGGRGG